jgi:hypothetical protein
VIGKPETVWEFPVEGGLVLARPESPVLFLLNSTAALLWHLFEELNDLPSVVAQFADLCSISQDRAARDIEATLQNWSQSILRPDFRACSSVLHPSPSSPAFAAASLVDTYAINSSKFRLLFYDPELKAELVPRLAPLRKASTASEPIVEIRLFRCNGAFYAVSHKVPTHGDSSCPEMLVSEPTANAARAALLPELVRLASPGRQWLCIVHAAACALGGRCLLLPARSHSGKTTLMAALMHEGFDFLCDDSAAIDRETSFAVPMPYALMVREESWEVLRPRYPELTDLPIVSRNSEQVRFLTPRSMPGASGMRTEAMVFPKFVPGGAPALTRIDSFQTLLRLQESGFWTPHDQASIRTFLDWAQSVPAYDFQYSDLDQAVKQVRLLLQSPGLQPMG